MALKDFSRADLSRLPSGYTDVDESCGWNLVCGVQCSLYGLIPYKTTLKRLIYLSLEHAIEHMIR